MFGDLFNAVIDVVTLPVNVVAAVTDELIDSDINRTVEDIKDVIKID